MLLRQGRLGSLSNMTGVFAGREEETQTQREICHVKRRAEIRVMLPQAKAHLGLPEAGRDKESILSRGSTNTLVLDF